jgi:SAM-dependent methyltransferase
VARQRHFYDTGAHGHLQVHAHDVHAERVAGRVARRLGIGPAHRVLEVGAGFGRFSFPLLRHCGSLVAVDISARALAALDARRAQLGIPADRCRTLQADVASPLPEATPHCDFVVGFFILHHLPDFAATIRALRGRLAAGGGAAFVEPNRRNPLFALQVACCPDMHFAAERGLFTLSARRVEQALAGAGLVDAATERFGFFPPALVNGSARLRRLEDRLQHARALQWVLPFLLCTARLPPGS